MFLIGAEGFIPRRCSKRRFEAASQKRYESRLHYLWQTFKMRTEIAYAFYLRVSFRNSLIYVCACTPCNCALIARARTLKRARLYIFKERLKTPHSFSGVFIFEFSLENPLIHCALTHTNVPTLETDVPLIIAFERAPYLAALRRDWYVIKPYGKNARLFFLSVPPSSRDTCHQVSPRISQDSAYIVLFRRHLPKRA